MRDKLFVFECDELKLVHHDIRLDGFQRRKVGGKNHFNIYFGMRDTINVILGDKNADALDKKLREKLKEDLELDKEISKNFEDRYGKMLKKSKKQ